MIKGKTFFLLLSLFLNGLFISVFITAILSNPPSTLSFYSMDREGSLYATAAMVVSAPSGNTITFNAVEISLKPGDRAFIQFSAIIGKNQANWIMETLYDHGIINVQKTGFGIIITALKTGECVLQTLGNDGITDIALVKVID